MPRQCLPVIVSTEGSRGLRAPLPLARRRAGGSWRCSTAWAGFLASFLLAGFAQAQTVVVEGSPVTVPSVAHPSPWSLGAALVVGDTADGELIIENDGDVDNSGEGVIGNKATSRSTVTVAGAGSTWTTLGHWLLVGNAGTGLLTIRQGGAVSNGNAILGNFANADGVVLVQGAGSTWTSSGLAWVGHAGTASVAISNGGRASSQAGSIGHGGASGGAVSVSGAGSTWVNADALYVGNLGSGSLAIADGASVSNSIGYIGVEASGAGMVTVTGAGSAWSNSADLHVGDLGHGTLSVTGGGVVSSVTGIVGAGAAATGTVTVDGDGSRWGNTANLSVADVGAGALHIRNGGSVTNEFGYVGYQLGATGSVTVDGVGSAWTNARDLYLGNFGTGTLTISNGGAASNVEAYVGANSSGNGQVTVDGPGSAWTSQTLFVGTGGTGAVRVANGGRVDSSGGSVGHTGGASGSVVVDGVGSLWLSNHLVVGNLGDGVLTVANEGQVESAAMSLGINGGQGRINIGGDPVTSSATGPGTLDTPVVGFYAPTAALAFNHTGTDHVFTPELRGQGLIHHVSGTTILAADSGSFTGATDVIGGMLRVDGRLGGSGSTVKVASGGVLSGSGTLGGPVAVASGGTLMPGAPDGPGDTLTVAAGGVTAQAGATLRFGLGNAAASRLSVAGPVDLGGATLALALAPGFVPAAGQQWTLVDNAAGAAPVQAQFAQGTQITTGGHVFSIDYAGGDGNDVVLTALVLPSKTVTPVPTLGHWSLILMGLLAAGLGVRRLQTR